MVVKEEISTIKQINSEATPIVSLSVTNLDIEVEEGKVYKDSFFIESENKVPIEDMSVQPAIRWRQRLNG